MALSTVTVIETAVTAIFATLKDQRDFNPRVEQGLELLLELQRIISPLYVPELDITITDATDAGVAEAIAVDGELGLAWVALSGHTNELTMPVGTVFQVGGTGDVTDDALATAKGGACADGDIFQITGADAVTYLGAAQPDFSDEERADF